MSKIIENRKNEIYTKLLPIKAWSLFRQVILVMLGILKHQSQDSNFTE